MQISVNFRLYRNGYTEKDHLCFRLLKKGFKKSFRYLNYITLGFFVKILVSSFLIISSISIFYAASRVNVSPCTTQGFSPLFLVRNKFCYWY